jgi:hypothetical protein
MVLNGDLRTQNALEMILDVVLAAPSTKLVGYNYVPTENLDFQIV